MTPERLAKLREWVTCDPEYRDRSACLSNGQVQELLDHIDAQRRELAEVKQISGLLCDRCGWGGIRANDPCAFCEVDSLRAQLDLTKRDRDLIRYELETVRKAL